jgi:hypothetical protein
MQNAVRNLKGAIAASRWKTQLAFAAAAGVNTVRLNRLCQGWVPPSLAEKEKFSKLLGVDGDWLFRAFAIPSSGEVDCTDPVDGMIAAVETFMKQTEPKAANPKG